MTGNGEMDDLNEIAGLRILQKPWTDTELAEEIRQALIQDQPPRDERSTSLANHVMLPGMKQRIVVPV